MCCAVLCSWIVDRPAESASDVSPWLLPEGPQWSPHGHLPKVRHRCSARTGSWAGNDRRWRQRYDRVWDTTGQRTYVSVFICLSSCTRSTRPIVIIIIIIFIIIIIIMPVRRRDYVRRMSKYRNVYYHWSLDIRTQYTTGTILSVLYRSLDTENNSARGMRTIRSTGGDIWWCYSVSAL